MPRRSIVLRGRTGKAVPPRLRFVALLREVQREWEHVYKRDGFESAACRQLATSGTALSEAFKLECARRERSREVRSRQAANG